MAKPAVVATPEPLARLSAVSGELDNSIRSVCLRAGDLRKLIRVVEAATRLRSQGYSVSDEMTFALEELRA